MKKHLLAVLVAALAVSACAGVDEQIAPTTTLGVVVSTTVAEATTARDTLGEALDEALAAGSYAFSGTLRLSVAGGVAETVLEGWVDGSDRLLRVNLDGVEQTTLVKDGVATVTRGDESVEIALRDAGDAPSLDLLRSVDDLTPDGTELMGTLSAAVLTDSGFTTAQDAHAVIRLSDAGTLAGYDLASSDLTWSMSVDFSEFGATFSG